MDKQTPTLEANQERQPNSKRVGSRLLLLYWLVLVAWLGVFGFALAPRLGFFGEQVNYWLHYPFFRGGSEGLILSEATIIRSGGSIYVPLRSDLFISAPYPPLYYYLLSWFWGANGTPAEGFGTGRLISLGAAIAVVAAIMALVIADVLRPKMVTLSAAESLNRKGNSLLHGDKVKVGLAAIAGLSGGLLFLTMPAVSIWALRVRADMLMTAFMLVGLAMIAWQPRGWLAFAAIVPLTLALYTKHTALAAPAASFAYLLFQNWHNWKRIIGWVAAMLTAVLVPFFVINGLSANQFYLRLFDYHNLAWLGSNFKTYWDLFFGENAGVLILGGCLLGWTAVAVVRQFIRGNNREWNSLLHKGGAALGQVSLTLWYFLASLPVLGGLGVSGADHNHFLPAEAATCAAAAVLLGLTIIRAGDNNGKAWAGWLALPILAILVWQVVVCAVPNSRYEIEFRQSKPDELRQLEAIAHSIADNPGAILTSEAAWFVLGNKDQFSLIYNDLFTLAALSKQKQYDSNGLFEAIRQKRFGLIVAKDNILDGQNRPDVWTPELVAVLKENYRLKFSDIWFQFEPKP